MSEILVKEYRGNIVENVHHGSIAVVSSTGDTIAYLGDIEKQTFMRSASKPIQVLPTLLAGLHRRFNLTDEDVAMFNSSHWGSNHHIFVLEEISRKTGINPEDMIMKPCSSTSASALAAKLTDRTKLHPRQGQSKLQHCCSGKHFSLMLLQRELTGKPDGYHLKDSPVQQQIINFISMLSQTPTYKIGLGIDGCGVPVFALPLRSIAMSYAKLMDPFSLSNELRETIDYNFSCIHRYPEKINDYGTPSYYINQNPDLIMKDGSRGVICMAIKSMKLGIAVKLEDGWTDEFQGLIIASILEQLKYDDTELIEKLKNCYTTKLYNDCGIEVGHSEADFKLDIDPTFFEKPEEYIPSDEEQDEDYDPDKDSVFSEDYDSDEDDSTSGETGSRSSVTNTVRDDLSANGYNPDKDSAFSDRYEPNKDSAFNDEYEADSDSAFSSGYEPDKDSAFRNEHDSVSDSEFPDVHNTGNTDSDDEDAIIDEIIARNEDSASTDAPAKEMSDEEQRILRNRKSILGMTVVKPSANKTFISNPREDPINAKPQQKHHDTADNASFSPAAGSEPDPAATAFSGEYSNREIKSANILSQKKRD